MKGINVLAVMEIDALHAWQSRHGDPDIQKEFGEESAEARAAVAELIELADMMERCAYEVSTEIDARGHRWSEAYLDEVLPKLRKALRRVKGEG